MNIICHRGCWTNENDKNTWNSLIKSLDLGYGIETDIRDHNGRLVISHDPVGTELPLELESLLIYYSFNKCTTCLALNIKSDGLHKMVAVLMREYDINNFFVFDMSIPDSLNYHKFKIPSAFRLSEYEVSNSLISNSKWIWLDAFKGDWYTTEMVKYWISEDKNVCVVSPELHSRPYLDSWHKLASLKSEKKIYLCTDLFLEASDFFKNE